MSQKSENMIAPEEIIHIILKRRWFIIIPFCISVIIGIYQAVTLPKTYKSSTTIMVQAQSVPNSYVQSVVSSDISSRLNTITQQVMSRTNIERIINDYNLFSGHGYEKMFLEDKVASIRNNIDVSVNRSRSSNGLSTFSISFRGSNPEKIRDIANALAAYFIDENEKVREALATGTSEFLTDELESMRKKLEKSEQAYREYSQKYRGELPRQLQGNLNNLEHVREELLDQQQALRETIAAKAALEQQISESQNSAQPLAGGPDGADSGNLEDLQAQLEALRAKYTESHPSVVRLKNMIKNVKDNAAEIGSEEDTLGFEAANNLTPQEKQLQALNSQIANMEAEIADLKNQAQVYQKRIDNTPKREEELLSIQRDYDNLKSIYDSLVNRRLEAEISVNMEKKQKGERFQVLDSAQIPQRPVSPDMKKLFMMSIAIGLGFGIGIVFVLEFMNKSFRQIDDVESTLGLPVLAAVPAILTNRDKMLSRLNNFLSIVSIIFSGILFAGFALLALKGSDDAFELFSRFL